MAAINSRKKSIIAYSEIPLFFSLVDYRNNYFMSDDPNKIIEFYNGFENRDQLIQWMKERPKGVANIHEVEGDKDIIVVIPTADFNGKYAKECRENIFKGLHIVFVESGEVPDPYFNYAHNCNVGIRKAMEYNPKWIVLSNDDMILIDSIDVLKSQLSSVSNEVQVLFCTSSNYHSYKVYISKIRRSYIIRNKFSKRDQYLTLLKKFTIEFITTSFVGPSFLNTLYNYLYFKRLFGYWQIGSFGIFSPELIREANNKMFDEVYINHMEDSDLSFLLYITKKRIGFINYRIGDMIGSSIGRGELRKLRSISSQAYFNYKNREIIRHNREIIKLRRKASGHDDVQM